MSETQERRKQIVIDLVKELIAKEGHIVRSLVRVIVYPDSISTFAVTCLYTISNEYDEYSRHRKSFWAYCYEHINNGCVELVETKFEKWPPKIKIKVPEKSSKSLAEWAEWLEKRKLNVSR